MATQTGYGLSATLNSAGLNSQSAKGRNVRKYRICVLGPSFVGKTSIVNRFINNSFSPYYDPTLHASVYRKAYNIFEDEDAEPQYVELELIDVFPHDHPLLDKDPDYNELAQEMSLLLNDIVKNNGDANTKIHAYLFIYDASNKYTFDTLCALIETIKEIEKSERRGKKNMLYSPWKMVIGNKKDLKKKKQILDKADIKKLDGMRLREVSALTNQGIAEAFKVLVQDIQSDNILQKEFHDQEKLRNKGQDELKEQDRRDDETSSEEEAQSSQDEAEVDENGNIVKSDKDGDNDKNKKDKKKQTESNCTVY